MPSPTFLWVLGAGFSAPVGGPLLNDLVGPSTQMRAARFGWAEPDRLWALNSIYDVGLSFGQWSNPENFIAYVLDACAFHPKAATLYAIARQAQHERGSHTFVIDGEKLERPRGDFSWVAGTVGDFAKECRRLALLQLSVATSDFTDEARRSRTASTADDVLDSELWLPYRSWLDRLDGEHCLATFNYDTTVEIASGGRVPAPLPGEAPPGGPELVKLHGSIDWHECDGLLHRVDNLEPAASKGFEPFIGVPGREKYQRSHALDALWDRACHAAQNAKVIVFMGYRFPESDNYANHRLLNAVRANPDKYLRIFLVLGPDDSSDARRVMQLLRWACVGKIYCRIHNTRLYTQDMMLRYDRSLLLDDEPPD